MDALRYHSRPQLRSPVLIAAFRGWNDAAEAATTAAEFLRKAWRQQPYASIDPEEFLDFQVNRPRVTLVDGITRRIEWPATELSTSEIPGSNRDAIVLTGVEPNVRWRTFCECVVRLARESGVDLVVTLGALLADVPHSRPVRVTGTAADPELVRRLGLARSRYEGPTGIVGILHDTCRTDGLDSVSLWAAVPHYVSANPSPKAALELIHRLGALVGFEVDTTPLEEGAREYEERVASAVAENPDVASYVRMLEDRSDEEEMLEVPSADELAAEFERFLDGLRGED